MKIARRFTKPGQDALKSVQYEKRTSRIGNPDGSVVFEMNDAEIPTSWSQLATDIMVSKYFRKAGVPQVDSGGNPIRDAQGNVVTGPEKSVKQVVNRLAGCWRYWGEKYGYFDTSEDAQAFYDELSHMLLHQMCAPNSPQWFNTGLNHAYGITGPSQGHFYCDPRTGDLMRSKDAYSHPQPHACQPYHALVSTPKGPVAIGQIVVEEILGVEVFDGTENGSGTTRVVAVKENGRKEVFEVELENGACIEATADHLVWCQLHGAPAPAWLELGELREGDRLFSRATRGVAQYPEESARSAAIFSARREESDVRSVLQIAALHADCQEYPATSRKTATRGETPVPRETPPQLDCCMHSLAVKRIRSVGFHRVYDIQTESGQYLSNNVIVHNCFIQSVSDDLVNSGGIMDLWTREARLFKYGSGTGSNFSRLRGENEPLSGGGKSSGLMSFLKIGDRAAGAIKSGGTTRRAAKMVCLDLDHPDVESFVNWKVREELKVAAMAEGMKRLPADQRALAEQLKLKLDYDFNGEAYITVSGQNSNNSVRIPNRFFKAVEEDGDWTLYWRTNGKAAKTMKARDLWEQIGFAAWRCADPGVQYDDTINQWHTCPRSGRINASNPCVTGDTRVLTPGGIWRRIDQMIHLPTRLVTNADAQEIHPSEGAFPTGSKEVFELRTAGGYTLKLTADHKVWTRSRGWVEARELRLDDEVKLPSKPAAVHEIGDPQDMRFFQMLGLFLSDANGDATAVHLDRCLSSGEGIDGFAQYASGQWGTTSYPDDYVNRAMVEEQEDQADEGGGTMTLRLTNRRLLSRLGAFIRTERAGSRLGEEAFTVGLAAQKHLLRGLFSADGVIANGTLELRSDRLSLLEDVQLLLLGFGVQSALIDPSLSVLGPQSSLLQSTRGGLPSDADSKRHGLRIDSGSLRSFGKYIGLLPGRKLAALADAISYAIARDEKAGNYDRVASLRSTGVEHVFDLTEPVTHSFVANGLTVHNCSEYMFLDDTACNLASLNVLTFFDSESRTFDTEAYRHGIRLWTIVLEVSVLMASFPSEEIAKLSYKYRTLGLGYANLGAMLMQAGIPYDSEKGRGICAALTSILTGESYATSAEMAAELGAFPGYEENKNEMLRVIRNHRRAAYDVTHSHPGRKACGDYETLDIKPVGIDPTQFTEGDALAGKPLLGAARDCWDRALSLGERHGFRNAQTTVIAPTGTIGLLMDCDTTGVEPDFALVKFKKLAGGGYFKIANQSLRPALEALGYSAPEINGILTYVMGTLTVNDAPHINRDSLRLAGFRDDELEKIEASLPGVFELSFAFSPWNMGKETLARLNVTEADSGAPNFNLLRKLGFTRKQIDEANDVICGRGTIEGAPLLKEAHLPVFDCANKCGRHGKRFIHVEGHIRMMAAAQPFISGAISKTINLPNEATIEEIKSSYELSWKLGLKANALYRDGSKLSQPLNVKSDADLDAVEEDDEENVAAAKDEVARDVISATSSVLSPRSSVLGSSALRSDNISTTTPHQIEKIIERIVERPLRRRLPDTRKALTHKFDVAGHEGYITVGLYDDGQPGEVFITMAKEGSTIGGLMDTIATLVSVALQYGVPVESLVRKFEHVRFEPSGMTRNREIPIAKSLVDYIFRWLAMEFIPGYRNANAPRRADDTSPKPAIPPQSHPAPPAPAPENPASGDTTPTTTHKRGGNGHGTRHDPDPGKVLDGIGADDSLRHPHEAATTAPGGGVNLRLAIVADPLSQQGSEMQADAPACDVCGSITVRSGTCYKCLNCGNSMGCS